MVETMDATKIRNVAVIAHVDHGKTTLVDALLKQTHVFRDNEAEMGQVCILDSNELERERGITILAKHCSVRYRDYKINIIDTPGHADFSGEVERTLGMASGALLIIDAQEGPMPQTRFVLRKALELGLKVIVVINKIDKPLARIDEVLKQTGDLFLELATDSGHLDFPVLFAVGREGKVFKTRPETAEAPGDVTALLETILAVVPPPQVEEGPFKMLVSSLDYDAHWGPIAIGRIFRGAVVSGQPVVWSSVPGERYLTGRVMVAEGLHRVAVPEAGAGDVVVLTGVGEVRIGETLTAPEESSPLPSPAIGEPTLHMTLGANTSPFSGREGKFITSRKLGERLERELKTNLSLRVEPAGRGQFEIFGRGELHLAILLETMRREGYEMEVGKPQVITKMIDGVLSEPVEEVDIVVPSSQVGVISQELGRRYAELKRMKPISDTEVEFVYHAPTRVLIGLRSLLLTKTKGTIVFASQLLGYFPMGRELSKLRSGVLITSGAGDAVTFGLNVAQGHGPTFVPPGTPVYEGMIIGQNNTEKDIAINVCKSKELSNQRAKSAEAIIPLAPPVILSLEQALDFLEPDELLEITPSSLRLRKKLLTNLERRVRRRKETPSE